MISVRIDWYDLQRHRCNKRKNRLSDTENKLVITNGKKEWREGHKRGRKLKATTHYV